MIYVLALLLALNGRAAAAELTVTLRAAEEGALANSDQYKSARFSAEAARAAASAAGSLLGPRLGLEGSLRYAETVPRISLPAAMGGDRPLGDNWNYSVGPSAYWTLFDGGAARAAFKSASHIAASRSAEAEHAARQAVLKARTAYFRLQLALEKVYLIGEDLRLSMSQLRDISTGARAGSRSRLDEIRARQEATARRRDLLRARSALGASLRDLYFAAGMELPEGASLPLDHRMAGRDYGEAGPDPLFIKAEPYGDMLERMAGAAAVWSGSETPAVRALASAGRAYEARAGAYKAERYPRVVAGARTSLDYPNGPRLYSFLQNSASLSLSLPLFENGRSSANEMESAMDSAAMMGKKDEAASAAERDHKKALDAYKALAAEQELNVAAVDDAAEAARLAYESYKAGGATWLEVESANLKSMQAKTTAAEASAEMLIDLAVLDSLKE